MKTHTEPAVAEHYDENFYKGQVAESLQSAKIYLKFLWQFLQPVSVVDVGCGRGAWLKACHELGSESLLGLDGEWNRQELMIDPDITFRSIDLNKPFKIPGKVDLAMTLEVAEHLEPASAAQFVKCLTDASDAVLFSAAYTNQGGTNHINEQPHTYWANLFAQCGFLPFDLFRAKFWDDENVGYWYRQNAFLYLRKGSPVYDQIKSRGFEEITNPGFMNCIHPVLLDRKINGNITFRSHLNDLLPSFVRAINHRLVRFSPSKTKT